MSFGPLTSAEERAAQELVLLYSEHDVRHTSRLSIYHHEEQASLIETKLLLCCGSFGVFLDQDTWYAEVPGFDLRWLGSGFPFQELAEALYAQVQPITGPVYLRSLDLPLEEFRPPWNTGTQKRSLYVPNLPEWDLNTKQLIWLKEEKAS